MNQRQEKVIIIIPTYNEALVIKDTINAIFKETAKVTEFNIHVLIFDSNSSDDTANIINQLKKTNPKIHLATERTKSGLGSAYLKAMNYAMTFLKADIVFEYDADGSHQPKYIAPMLEEIKNHDVVVGSRYVKGGQIPNNWPRLRKLFSVMGNYVARSVLHPKYKDYTSGFRATRTSLLKKILPSTFLSANYAYKLQLFWLLHLNKARIKEFPISFIDREKGESKLPKNSIGDALKVVFTLRFLRLKKYLTMCFVGVIGALIQFIVYNSLRISLSPFKANQFAVTAAIISNFTLNGQFTFREENNHQHFSIKRFGLFFIYSFLMVLMQSSWVHFISQHLGEGRLIENTALIIGMGLGSVMNYFFYSKIVWQKKITKAGEQ